MDEDRGARPLQVLVVSASKRVRTALRALLEASTSWSVREIPPAGLTTELRTSRPSAVLLDLIEVKHPPALPPAPVPPLVAITRTTVPAHLSGRLDAQVSIDDGVDAIVAAVDRVAR